MKPLTPDFMLEAVKIAETSGKDIPVGALIVKDGKIIASGVNEREKRNSVIAHAEIIAIEKATKLLNTYRLDDCSIYVTLEPCPMCASAILQARIKDIYFGAYDSLYGSFGSGCDMRELMKIKANVKGGIREDECSELLKNYFKGMRKC